jgi:membrane-bound inhibitor of C-type lysozyme
MIRALAAGLVTLATPAAAELELTTLQYLCDRGVVVPAAYVSDTVDSAVVTLMVDGRMFSLVGTAEGEAMRYAWPSDGSGYVWTVGGAAAVLAWRDGDAGTETPVLTCSELQ